MAKKTATAQLKRYEVTMKVRDAHAATNDDNAVYEMPSGGLEVIGDDGIASFTIHITKTGGIYVSTGSFCKHAGRLLDRGLVLKPRASNSVFIDRVDYTS